MRLVRLAMIFTVSASLFAQIVNLPPTAAPQPRHHPLAQRGAVQMPKRTVTNQKVAGKTEKKKIHKGKRKRIKIKNGSK